MREPGFYWVRRLPNMEWIVGLFEGDEWQLPYNGGMAYTEKELSEIDERRIVREEKCKDNQLKGAKIVGFIKEPKQMRCTKCGGLWDGRMLHKCDI